MNKLNATIASAPHPALGGASELPSRDGAAAPVGRSRRRARVSTLARITTSTQQGTPHP